MAEGRSGTFVVGIRHGEVDLDALKDAISRIEGVAEVEFNYLTRKFTVHYNGSPDTLQEIKGKLEGVARIAR
jgi:copper chaperone CopZ